jgi:glycosyltransferase involved in cell wall biosynthesis
VSLERLKIMHVQGEHFREGGAESYLHSIMAAQRKRGCHVSLLYNSGRPEAHEDEADEFFCPPSYGFRTGLKSRAAIRDLIQAWQPHVVHLHVSQYRMSPLIVRFLSRRLPTVQTIHDTLFLCLKQIAASSLVLSPRILPDGKPCLRPVGWRCADAGCVSQLRSRDGWLRTLRGALEARYRARACRSVDRLLVSSAFTREDLLRNGFADKQIRMLGIATEFPPEWESAARETPDPPEGPPNVLFVGKLVQAKGVWMFLDAMARLTHRTWQAVVIGDGPESATVKAHIAQLGLADRVRVEPAVHRSRLGHYYSRSRLLVFPSLWPESWGLVAVEAMRMGRPVVSFDSGAAPEWLEHGITGYLVNPGDVGSLSSRIEQLLLDRELACRMGQLARRRAERFFLMEEHVDRVLDVYREVIAGRRRHRRGIGRGKHAGA